MASPIKQIIESLFEEIANKYSGEEFTKNDLVKLYDGFKCNDVAKSKKSKDLNAPKRNLNVYMIFCRETRKAHPKVKHTTQALKTMWEDCDDKNPYTKMQEKEKKEYEKKMEVYKKSDEYKNFIESK